METTKSMDIRRRAFLSSSCLLLGAAALGAAPLAAQAVAGGAKLPEELSPEELALVKTSAMSEDMQNFWHKGYGCSETGLMVALRFLKKPEDLVWISSGFMGGLGRQDLCGFLTSGVMALGLYAGTLDMKKDAATARCGQLVGQYWDWWAGTAPLRCADIQGGRWNFKICERLGRLATAKLESLMLA